MALVANMIAGLFFLVGAFLAIFKRKQKGLIEFGIGLAFSVMVLLLAFDIVPEIVELYDDRGTVFMYVFIIIGIVLLKLIDLLVPHHDHDEKNSEHYHHLGHIGIISSLALIIHNVIEGIGIYNVALLDLKAGVLMAIGVGMHNIPFGLEITSTLSETKKSKMFMIFNIAVITISTVVGGILMMVFKTVNEFVLASLMSLTVGMVIYLVLFELLIELGASKNRRYSIIGLVAGVILMFAIFLIGG